MSDEVWWLSRDDNSSTVEIRDNRPAIDTVPAGRYAKLRDLIDAMLATCRRSIASRDEVVGLLKYLFRNQDLQSYFDRAILSDESRRILEIVEGEWMSIDHVVIGITRCDSGVFINCLQRDNPHLNETRFKLKNTPSDLMKLLPLLACDIWGNSSDVLVGNTHIATREGYSVFRLDSWDHVEKAIRKWKGNHAD